MFRSLLALLLAPAVVAAADGPPEIPLWPGTAPGEKGDVKPEEYQPPKANEAAPVKRLTNVSKPTIAVYRPASDTNTGAAVVIAPGGGYNILAYEHEGTQVAEWLQKIGVTGVLLKYRVPRRPGTPAGEPPVGALQDAQRAISTVRSRAKEWDIDPARVGMLGFSAGGHLTAWAATNPDKRAYEAVDDTDKASCRPDFAVMIYPGGVVEKGSKDKLRPEVRVSKDAPPSFLAVSADDKGSFFSTASLAVALREAEVPVELHVYESGGHGWGMRKADKTHANWTRDCADWMRARGLLTAKK